MSRYRDSQQTQRTVAELLAQHGGDTESTARRRHRRRADDADEDGDGQPDIATTAPQAIIDRIQAEAPDAGEEPGGRGRNGSPDADTSIGVNGSAAADQTASQPRRAWPEPAPEQHGQPPQSQPPQSHPAQSHPQPQRRPAPGPRRSPPGPRRPHPDSGYVTPVTEAGPVPEEGRPQRQESTVNRRKDTATVPEEDQAGAGATDSVGAQPGFAGEYAAGASGRGDPDTDEIPIVGIRPQSRPRADHHVRQTFGGEAAAAGGTARGRVAGEDHAEGSHVTAHGQPGFAGAPDLGYDDDRAVLDEGRSVRLDDERDARPDDGGHMAEDVEDQVEDRIEEDYYEDDDDAAEASPGKQWLAMAAQLGFGVAGGAAVWLAFNWFWAQLPAAAVIAALAVTVGLVWLVRKIRRAEDMQTTVLAVFVGLVISVSPAAMLLLSR